MSDPADSLALMCDGCKTVMMRAHLARTLYPDACPGCGFSGKLKPYTPQFVRREIIKRPRMPTP